MTTSSQPAPRWPRTIGATLLLLVGVAAWRYLGGMGTGGAPATVAALVALIVGLALVVPRATRPAVDAALAKIEQPTPRARAITAGAIAFLTAAYLLQNANARERMFGPVLHDEHGYIIQARMLATGRLWLPRHELADHFDSFHLLTDRVYAPKYSPGTAFFYAPAVLIGVDLWLVTLALSAAAAAMLYLVVTELVDGLAGLLAVLMLLGLFHFRRASVEIISQPAMLLLLLLALRAYLHWRRGLAAPDAPPRKRLAWIALLGVCVGWGAITRPADAFFVALPLLAAVLLDVRRLPRRQILSTLAVGLAATLPFLAVQLVFNKGLTGRWLELPWAYYAERYDPYDNTSLAPYDPARRTRSVVPQVQVFEQAVIIPAYRQKIAAAAHDRVLWMCHQVLTNALPNALLIVLVPVGLLAAFARGRWVLVVMLVPWVWLHARYTAFIDHYVLVVAPAVFVLTLLGLRSLAALLPARAARPGALVGALVVAALALAALPQFAATPRPEEWQTAPLLRVVDARLARLERTPAVVLFTFDPARDNPHVEPVYNIDVPWPDDAPVIRAHDLGPDRNRALFAYYARHAPDRAVYRYHRNRDGPDNDPLEYLGTARELAAR